MSNIEVKIDELKRKIEDIELAIDEDKGKDIIIDRLHEEVIAFRNNLLEKSTNNILLEIIHLIDANQKLREDLVEKDIEGKEQIINYIESLSYDLDDILYRNNVEHYVNDTDTIDSRTQTIVESVPTSNEELIGKRKSTISLGYHRDGEILRKERVSVYRTEGK